MNVLLEPPRTVVCVAADQPVATELAARLSECDVDDVVACETERAAEQIRSGKCGCVVLHEHIGHDEVVERCQSVRSKDDDLPLIVVREDDSGSIATAATVAGASATLGTPDDEQLQSVVTDELTAYVRHRRAAEESEILDAMLDGLETPLYAKDTAARHLKIADIRGEQDPSDAIGKTDIELYGDESSRFARGAYEDDMTVLESETAVFNRDESHGPSGTHHWSRTTKVPWHDEEGGLKGLVGVSYDITELKQKEARLQEVRDRFREFAEHLSHDLQNPLQVASGYLEMAKSSGDPAAFERVEAALDRMEEMIDDMSAIASHRGTEADNATTCLSRRSIRNPNGLPSVCTSIPLTPSCEEASCPQYDQHIFESAQWMSQQWPTVTRCVSSFRHTTRRRRSAMSSGRSSATASNTSS